MVTFRRLQAKGKWVFRSRGVSTRHCPNSYVVGAGGCTIATHRRPLVEAFASTRRRADLSSPLASRFTASAAHSARDSRPTRRLQRPPSPYHNLCCFSFATRVSVLSWVVGGVVWRVTSRAAVGRRYVAGNGTAIGAGSTSPADRTADVTQANRHPAEPQAFTQGRPLGRPTYSLASLNDEL